MPRAKYYIAKNSSGYYQVRFLNQATGKILFRKSTHTTNLRQAIVMAEKWIDEGVPVAKTSTRTYETKPNEISSFKTIVSLLANLNSDESAKLIGLLHEQLSVMAVQEEVINLPEIQPSRLVAAGHVVLQNKLSEVAYREIGKTVTKAEQPDPVEFREPPVKAKVIVHKKTAVTGVTVQPEQKAEPVKLIEQMRSFWKYDTSRWVKEQRALGYEPTERHCDEQYKLIDRYWAPYFGESVTAEELDSETLQEFFFYLRIERELSGATVNQAISCGSMVFGYMFQKKLIAENPFERVRRFKKNEKERSIPTESEVAALLKTEWCNEPSYLAFYLGAFCGMRAGEISGLRMCDLDVDGALIHVRHSWNNKDGLKSTKNTDCRSVPIDAGTLQRILCYARKNPKAGELSYVFWTSVDPATPFWPSYYRDGLYLAMQSIGISEEQRKDRNIVFHSLRHFCATILTKRGDLDTVRQILGHRTEAMTKHYSNHESEEKQRAMRDALEKSREYIFNFKAG